MRTASHKSVGGLQINTHISQDLVQVREKMFYCEMNACGWWCYYLFLDGFECLVERLSKIVA